MSSADLRRKRKRILRQYTESPLLSLRHLLNLRSLVLCFSFLTLLYLLSHSIPFTFHHPVLVVSTLSLLPSSTTAESVHQDFGNLLFPPKIEARVLFPDHVLLLVSTKNNGLVNGFLDDEFECVYYGKNLLNFSGNFLVKKVVSLDDYDEFRAIVRCPIPSVNYSYHVNLKWSGKTNGVWMNGGNKQTFVNSCLSWDNVVYDASVDKGTVVLFVKGLNLRPDRIMDPRPFTCHFGLGKSEERSVKYVLKTKALSAAQEVIRCPVPLSLRSSEGEGMIVTVGLRHQLMPSVARIYGGKRRRTGGKKHELCVCTMVWNQGSAIREWIMYHAWLGVERWFVYDNNSDDQTNEVVQELDREHYNVTRHAWPWIKTQEAGFSHCALRARDECSWVAFMDVDEYFYFPRFRKSGKNTLRDLVSNFSSSFKKVAEIRTSCHSFGPSGLTEPPPQGVTVGYTCRLQSPERHKSIIKPEALDATLLNVVHHFRIKKGFKYVNLPQTTAVINHYKYQVWAVFQAKFHRRVATYVVDWQENQNEGSRDRVPGLGTEAVEPPDWPRKFCKVWDTGLRNFVLAMLSDSDTGLLPWETRLIQ